MSQPARSALLPFVVQSRSLSELALRVRVSGVLGFFLIIAIIFSLLTSRFLTFQNITVITSNAAILAIVAAAQAIVLLTRNVDVSVGSIMGFTAYLTADYAAHHPGVGPELVLMAMLIGLILGLMNGLLVAYGKVSSLIATLATMSLYRGFTFIYAHGQEVTSNRLPRWMLESVDFRVSSIPVLVIFCIIIVTGIAIFLRDYPLGRQIYAIGSNALASVFYGLRTQRIILLAFGLSGLLCGLAGFLYAARVGTVTVILASGWEMASLAAAVIGGVSVTGGSGTVIGAALGALVLATIDNGLVLLGIPEFWRMFVQGSSIVAAAAVDVLIGVGISKSLQRRRFGRSAA
ncbi:MAG: ABC transporter permease [Verrucomicrobia bacterium]|nr:ABC transporter permease [Verrucomicrobiota bacterium]